MEKKAAKRGPGRPMGARNRAPKRPRPDNGEFFILGAVFYDRERIAKELNASLATVQRLHASGLLKYIEAGHNKVSSPEWIREYIERRASEREPAGSK